MGHVEMSRSRVAHHGFTGHLPTAIAPSCEAPYKLDGHNAKQFSIGSRFEIVQNLSHILPFKFNIDGIVLWSGNLGYVIREFGLQVCGHRVGVLIGEGWQDTDVVSVNLGIAL